MSWKKKTVTASLWVFSNARLLKFPPRLKHSCREIPLKGKWTTTQNSFTNSLKLTRFTRSLLARVSNKSWGSHSYKEVGMQSRLSEAELQKRLRPNSYLQVETSWIALTKFRPESLGKDAPICWGPTGGAVCSRLPTFVACHLCWGGHWWCTCLYIISAPV